MAPPERSRRWSVYVLRCRDGALYTGIATDVTRRLAEHESGLGKGAKALRGRGPLTLVMWQVVGEQGLALQVEARIKQLSKARKEQLLIQGELLEHVLEDLLDDD